MTYCCSADQSLNHLSSPETLVLRHMADVGWLSVSGELFGIGPLALRHSRYFPIGRGNPQNSPSQRAHLERCGTKAFCSSLVPPADCCRTSQWSACAATQPSSQTALISTHHRLPVSHSRCHLCYGFQGRTPQLAPDLRVLRGTAE